MKHYPLTPQIAWMLQELARKADQRTEDYLRDLIMNTYTESINKQQFSNPFSNPN
tara:strand:+ start:1475 stop:1639 length:165 start_codon:yes stop_codon:yes gene_type:complete